MPSTGDFFNEIHQVNVQLDAVKGHLQALKVSLDSVVTLETYANEALYHNAKQNDTIICILEHISENTCRLLNEAAVQTRLQTSIEASTRQLAALFAATHAEAALALDKQEELREQIEKCCPPRPPEPACHHERCPSPGTLKEPPKGERPPVIERTGRK